MNNWLARIVADVRRANQWLDPQWNPRRRMQVVFTAATRSGMRMTLWTLG